MPEEIQPEWSVRNRLLLYRPAMFSSQSPTTLREEETWELLIEQRTSGPQRGQCRTKATLQGIGAVAGYADEIPLAKARQRAARFGSVLAGFIREGKLIIQGLDLEGNTFDMEGEEALLRVLRRQRGKVLHAE